MICYWYITVFAFWYISAFIANNSWAISFFVYYDSYFFVLFEIFVYSFPCYIWKNFILLFCHIYKKYSFVVLFKEFIIHLIFLFQIKSAQSGIWTHTPIQALPPQGSVSTSSTIWANSDIFFMYWCSMLCRFVLIILIWLINVA